MREVERLPVPNDVHGQSTSSDETSIPSSSTSAPPAKKARSSLFASYNKSSAQVTAPQVAPIRCTLQAYLESAAASSNSGVKDIIANDQFKSLQRLVASMYCVPATSAPVERIFSHGGIFMRPHRARMSDSVLSDLVFTKCNCDLK